MTNNKTIFQLSDGQRRDILQFFDGAGRFTNDLKDLGVTEGLDHANLVRSLATAGLLDHVYGSTRGTVYTLSSLGKVVLQALD